MIAFYLQYHEQEDYAASFSAFLKRLTAFLLLRYLEMPTISAIKGDVLKLDVAVIESSKPIFPNAQIDREALRPNIFEPHTKIVRMLLKILAYNKQSTLLPKAWDIEHIFPQKWECGYFKHDGISDDFVRNKLEHIGNKVPFETVKNIKASNGFFVKKKELYQTSEIEIVKELCSYPQWGLDQIGNRDVHISDEIMDTLEAWMTEYDANVKK